MKNKILLVDDEPEILNTLGFLLAHEGYEIETASNGEEALVALADNSFKAVVCDLLMPKLDGLSLLRKVRSDNKLIPFLFLSGHAGIEEELEVTNFGAYDLVHKPHLNQIPGALSKLIQADKEVKMLQDSGVEAMEFLELLHNSNKRVA